jgi:hypothetical protein|tara:strand:+ start:5496 stop:5687 length:192 start_codon:yes stop_codon:yes gene_type:complete
MNDQKEFEAKINRKAFKTAELRNGNGFIAIRDSYMQDGHAVVWGTLDGKHGLWFEDALKNFVL